METQAKKERKFTQAMEKWIMYFMYALFGGLFLLISTQGDWREGLILFPVAVVSLPLTKWGMRWQNERYVRSAQSCAEHLRGHEKYLHDRIRGY